MVEFARNIISAAGCMLIGGGLGMVAENRLGFSHANGWNIALTIAALLPIWIVR